MIMIELINMENLEQRAKDLRRKVLELSLEKGDNLSFLGKLVNKTSSRGDREFVEIEVKLLDQVILRKRHNRDQNLDQEAD